jgi:hypothetical protein
MSLVRPSEQLLAIPGESGLRRALRRVKRTVRGLLARPEAETADIPVSQPRRALQSRRVVLFVICFACMFGTLAVVISVERAVANQQSSLSKPGWRIIREPQALVLEGRQLMQQHAGSTLADIPENEWPAAISILLPYAVSASSTQVRIALNKSGPNPEHGYLIVSEGAVERDANLELTPDGAPGFFRYQAKE